MSLSDKVLYTLLESVSKDSRGILLKIGDIVKLSSEAKTILVRNQDDGNNRKAYLHADDEGKVTEIKETTKSEFSTIRVDYDLEEKDEDFVEASSKFYTKVERYEK